MEVPIIRVEIDSMKHRIAQMLMDNQDELQSMIMQSIERELTVEKLQEQMDYHVRVLIQKSIEDLPRNMYLRGVISEAIANMVQNQIKGASHDG